MIDMLRYQYYCTSLNPDIYIISYPCYTQVSEDEVDSAPDPDIEVCINTVRMCVSVCVCLCACVCMCMYLSVCLSVCVYIKTSMYKANLYIIILCTAKLSNMKTFVVFKFLIT